MTRPSYHNLFVIPVTNVKRSGLVVPSELVEVLDGKGKQLPVILEDESESKYAVLLDGEHHVIQGAGFNSWYRVHLAETGSPRDIHLEVIDVKEKRIRATVLSQRSGGSGLHIGWRWSTIGGEKAEIDGDYCLQLADLLTHAFICGSTGSGKTVLAKALLEEVLLSGVPCVVIDMKGDLSSMCVILDRDDPNILAQLRKGDTREARQQQTLEELNDHFDRLREHRLDLNKARKLKELVEPRVYTPRVATGIQLAFPAVIAAPPDVKELAKQDPNACKELARAVTDAFIDRLYPKAKRTKIENERNFVFEILSWAWENEVNLQGIEGLRQLVHLIEHPPFKTIGELSVEQYIDAENRRNRLLNKVNTLVSGPETLWFKGVPLTADLLIGRKGSKIPLSIINLSEIDRFEDRSFVVSQIAYTLGNWMRTQPGTDKPKVFFFIDEIGGGGGREALFPSHPYECAAKWGLNYLLRQGRAFGVCCCFATQNPGDIDYKGLSNCGIWAVGRLGTERDRSKAMESVSLSGRERRWLESFLTKAEPGDFAIKKPNGKVEYVKARWIFSYHRVLTADELRTLMAGT